MTFYRENVVLTTSYFWMRLLVEEHWSQTDPKGAVLISDYFRESTSSVWSYLGGNVLRLKPACASGSSWVLPKWRAIERTASRCWWSGSRKWRAWEVVEVARGIRLERESAHFRTSQACQELSGLEKPVRWHWRSENFIIKDNYWWKDRC